MTETAGDTFVSCSVVYVETEVFVAFGVEGSREEGLTFVPIRHINGRQFFPIAVSGGSIVAAINTPLGDMVFFCLPPGDLQIDVLADAFCQFYLQIMAMDRNAAIVPVGMPEGLGVIVQERSETAFHSIGRGTAELTDV